MFTVNRPEDAPDNWTYNPEDKFPDWAYMIYQWECGTNLHIQGYVYFKVRKAMKTLKALDPKVHWEPRGKSHKAAKHYCSKPHNGLEDPIHDNCKLFGCHSPTQCLCTHCDEERKNPTALPSTLQEFGSDDHIPDMSGERSDLKQIKEIIEKEEPKVALETIKEEFYGDYIRYYKSIDRELKTQRTKRNIEEMRKSFSEGLPRVWQKKALKDIESQSQRQIHWYWSEKGDMGKTQFAKYMLTHYDCYYCEGGKAIDIKHGYQGQKYVVFDFPRDYQEYVNYSVLESFKNGVMFSGKYDSQTEIIGDVTVVCLANFAPIDDNSKVSKGRFIIKKID